MGLVILKKVRNSVEVSSLEWTPMVAEATGQAAPRACSTTAQQQQEGIRPASDTALQCTALHRTSLHWTGTGTGNGTGFQGLGAGCWLGSKSTPPYESYAAG